MTRRDFILKWLLYGLALLPILVLDLYVLPWFPIFGVVPTLFPVAAVTAALFEGPAAGAGFGLFVGILSDALIPGLPGTMTFGLSLLGMLAGTMPRFGVRQDLSGCLLCSSAALAVIGLLRMASWWLRRKASLPELLYVALPELLLSLVFAPLVYLIFRWVFRRVPRTSLLL